MDYSRKIGRTKDSNIKWRRVYSPPSSVSDAPMVPDQPIVEDRHLINWKKWLANRQKHYKLYKSVTGRCPADLTMNACEKIRPLIEMKNLMDYATISAPVISNRFGGDPGFWKIPENLPDHGNPCLPKISISLTKKELKNVLPELEHVSLPELIEKEKDLTCLRKSEPGWKRSKYLHKRNEELLDRIKLIKPNEPETAELVVKGRKFDPVDDRVPRVPVITISDVSEEKTEESSIDPDVVVVLKIQDREIVRNNCFLRSANDEIPDSLTWSLNFEAPCEERSERTVLFENKGNITIMYQWREECIIPAALPLTKKSCFFFNKNKGIVLPGQIVQLPIWFYSHHPGIASETWRLETEPKLHPGPLLIRFWGCADSVDPDPIVVGPDLLSSDPRSIEEYLDRCIRNTTILEILDDVVNNVKVVESTDSAFGNLFLEGEIFRDKNPFCFYHAKLVNELRRIYESVVDENSPAWDLSMIYLHGLLLQIEDPKYRQEMLLRFNQLYQKCLKPRSINPIDNAKYTMVYDILRSFVNKFEAESDCSRANCLPKDRLGPTFDNHDDLARSVSISRSSQSSTSSRTKRSRKLSQVSSLQLIATSETSQQTFKLVNDNENDVISYKNLLSLRIYKLLTDAIGQICSTIDCLNNLYEINK